MTASHKDTENTKHSTDTQVNSLCGHVRQIGCQIHLCLEKDGFLLGDYKLDIVVEGVLVIELKAAKNIDDAHIAQLLGYLRSTDLNHGLLINFGSCKYQIRKFKI